MLQAIGFAPNVDGYGLEAAGVTLTDRKAIDIDDYMRTNVPHIYAIGDVTGLSCSWPTWPRPRVWWPPKPSPVQRLWHSATTG